MQINKESRELLEKVMTRLHNSIKNPWETQMEPYQVVPNVFYVGNKYVGSYLLKTDDNHHLYYSSYKKIHHEKKQKLSKEAQKMAELYTRLEILKSKQIEGVKTTRYTTDTIRACQGRIRKLLQEVGGIEEIQIKVDDARTLAEYFSGIRYLPEFEKNTEKAAGLFKAMQVIFNFSVVVKTLATYYYSKEKRERTNS